MNNTIHLPTQNLLLREIIPSDINHIYKGLSHPQVIQHYGVSFHSLEATQEQMDWYAEESQSWFAICAPDNAEFYGACGLNDISTEHKKAEVGLWLLPEFWGRGIMKEAMTTLCEYGFDSLGLHRIEGFVNSDNHNCKRAMSKLDFKYEGTMRDCELKNNKYVSIDIYALIRD